MNVIKYPQKEEWDELLKRPVMNVDTLRETVCRVLDDVKTGGDRAVMAYEKQFDHVELERLAVTEEEMDEAERLVSPELKDALRLAHDNIGKFHASQRFETTKVEVRPGVTCWQKAVPIERVGLYIPGGTAPLFSTVLMLATPAKIAGCREIVLCTPPGRDGKVHPAILCAARVAGVNRIFKAGGVQAIGAMAYGTESVPKVYKIFGPGNQYVMAAKQQVSLHDVAIDMPAGPSEVEVLADAGSNPVFVAADLLSQAEHGVDSQVLLVTTDEALVGKVQDEVERQLAALPRKEIAEQALTHSKLVVVRDMDEALELTNRYAPEHLIIETADYMPNVWSMQAACSSVLIRRRVRGIMLRVRIIRCLPMVMPRLIAVSTWTATTVRLRFRNLRRRGSVPSVRPWNSWRQASISMHTAMP